MANFTGSNRVIRGGSWNNNAQNLRSGNRNNNGPGNRNNNVGFRLVSTSLNSARRCRPRIASVLPRPCPGHYS
ncbi:MAG: SUMF1/EgtB/PvdO family nonheme iron enzyme [Bdellovibrionales bacterium]|nr:SUMF1/EgtB/PvdO family nonheme iron enzyme [Bdellovibrionales bacterium]